MIVKKRESLFEETSLTPFCVGDEVKIHINKNKQNKDGMELIGHVIYVSRFFITVEFGKYRESFLIHEISKTS